MAARHCAERVLLLAGQEGEVERRARRVQVRHVAHHERRRAALADSAVRSASPTARVQRRQVRSRWWPSRASRPSRRGRAARRAGRGRRSGCAARPRPGRRPSDTPPPARSSAAVRAAPALHVLLVALEADDREAAALVAAHAQVAPPELLGACCRSRPSAIVRRVSSSSESRLTSAAAPACSITRNASQPSAKLAERPALVAARRRRGPHAQRGLADHAEHALGAHHQLAQARARPRTPAAALRAELAGRASTQRTPSTSSSMRP